MELVTESLYLWQPTELWVLLTTVGDTTSPRLASREVYRDHRGALQHAARGAAARWRSPVRAVPLVQWVLADIGQIDVFDLWADFRHREVVP